MVHTLSQILGTTFKLTKKYSTLVYINRSFSLTQLLKMFHGATFYWNTVYVSKISIQLNLCAIIYPTTTLMG